MGFTKTMKAMATLAVSLFFSANAVCFAGEQNQNDEMSNGMKQQPSTTLRSATSYPEGSPVFHNGKLSVSGTQMVNECGKAIQLRGMSSHGLAWTPAAYTEESLTALVNEWNIDLFRIAVYTHEWGGYCMTGSQQWKTPDEFNKYIDGLVDICGKLGIYCLIDWHVLNQGSGNPNNTLDYAVPFWKYMSEKHKDDIHVIYEICNEPNGTNVTWDVVKKYADTVIPVIRENDPDKIIVCGSPTWSQDVDKAANNPLQYDNIMYTLHFYAGTHGDYLIQKAEAAMRKGLAIFVTEFGTSKADGNGGVFATECDVWMEWMEKNKISWANWSFVDKNETSAALVPGAVAKQEWTNVSTSGSYIMNYLWKPKAYESCQGVEVENKDHEPYYSPMTTVKSSSGSPFYHNGAISRSGSAFENACGKPVQLRGLTVGNAALNKSCLSTRALYKSLNYDWNISVLRVSVHADGKGGYAVEGNDKVMTEKEYQDYLDAVVENATRYGLYCIVDWHLTNGDLNAVEDKAISFWKFAAQRYSNYENVLFEICSNPTVEWSAIKSYAEKVTAIIREKNPNKTIICGTPKSNHDVESVVANPLSDKNTVYGFQIFAGADGKDLQNKMVDAAKKGVVFFVTDLSLLSSADGNSLNTNEANEWVAFLNDNGICWTASKFAADGDASSVLTDGACAAGNWTSTTAAGDFWKSKLGEKITFQSCKDDGLEKVAFDDMITFYPNPVKDELSIVVPSDKKVNEIQVYDVTGRFILASDQLEVNVTGLNPGVYYVKVVFPEGVSMKKIVKE